jgi:hypothetical protein
MKCMGFVAGTVTSGTAGGEFAGLIASKLCSYRGVSRSSGGGVVALAVATVLVAAVAVVAMAVAAAAVTVAVAVAVAVMIWFAHRALGVATLSRRYTG